MSLGSATRSEFTKHFTTSGWWVLTLVMVLYLAMTGGGFAATIGLVKTGQLESSGDTAMLAAITPEHVYGLGANLGYLFPLLLGAVMVTGELRYRTILPTFLATPKRTTVLIAKLVAGAVLGAALGVVAVIATAGPAAIAFNATGQPPALTEPDTLAMFGRIILGFAIWALIGIGVGSILRNQVAAVVTVLAFTLFIEPLVRTAAAFAPQLEPVTRYLPGAAADTLTGSDFYAMIGSGATDLPAWWVGAIVLAAYALVLTIIGALTTWRRDID